MSFFSVLLNQIIITHYALLQDFSYNHMKQNVNVEVAQQSI